MRFSFILVFGLFPLWVAIAVIAVLAVGDSETLVVTPWLLIVAIPASGVSLFIVLVTRAVKSRVKGDQERKDKYAATVFGSALLIVGVGIFLHFNKQKTMEQALQKETDLAEEFVRRNETVRSVVGNLERVMLSSKTDSGRGTLPVRYDFGVYGSKTIFAIVEINRSGPEPTFVLACTTPLAVGQREAFKDVCKQ